MADFARHENLKQIDVEYGQSEPFTEQIRYRFHTLMEFLANTFSNQW